MLRALRIVSTTVASDSAGGGRGAAEWARLVRGAAAALVVIAGVVAVAATASAQEEPSEPTVAVRIAAQRTEDGRAEFALQHDPDAHTGAPYDWGERLLPARRFFPSGATVGRWLVSTPLTVSPAGGADVTVRLMARLQADDRIEFAVQQQLAGGAWGDPRLPAQRFFPANVRVGRWLVSSPVVWNPTAAPEAPTGADAEPPAASVPAPPASVRFSAVDSGGAHACGLRSDGTVSCWGDNSQGQASAPGGEFTAVSAGLTHSCGLRGDGTVTCWGGNVNLQSDAPDEEFTAVSAGGYLSCGLRPDDTAVCWGRGFDQFDTNDFDPPLTVSAVAAGDRDACGLITDDGSVLCADETYDTPLHHGPFSALSAGGGHYCALGTDETVTCWGDDFHSEASPPDGRFKAVSAGGNHSCGLRTDDTVTCWGDDAGGAADPPDGRFSAVAAGGSHSCGLRSNGTITCWGRITQPRPDQRRPRPGRCGLDAGLRRNDGTGGARPGAQQLRPRRGASRRWRGARLGGSARRRLWRRRGGG